MRGPDRLVGPARSTARRLCHGVLVARSACAGERGERSADRDRALAGFVAPRSDPGAAALRGARLGAAEAERAGELVGRSFGLLVERAGSASEAEEAAQRLLDRGVFALVGGFDEASCRALSRVAERGRVLFLDVGCRSDALRAAPGRNTFHVEASDSMYRAMRPASGAGPEKGAVAVLWHAGLTRYGAAQLNERFVRQTGAPAEPAGWAGWMAVKVLWEALLRTGSTDAGVLSSFLAGDSARFDGHKGESLRFDPESHQLRQPIYRAVPGASAPPSGADGGPGDRGGSEPVPLDGSHYAFVSDEGSDDVSVIDLETYRVVSRIRMGARPRGIRVSPDGRHVYVALSDDVPTVQGDGDGIAAIDVHEGRVVARHPAGTDPEQFALSPDGRTLYAANEDAGTASITSLGSDEVLATLVVGIEPEGVAVSPDGRWVYVTAETSNTVSVIDTGSGEVTASFLADVRPRGVAFSPTAPRAYVTNEISGTLSVVDTRTHRVTATIPLHEGRAKPVGVVVSPDGGRIYVANGHTHSVSVIDAASNRVIGEVPVGRRPWGIAVSGDGRRVYTANGGSNDVSVIDAGTLRVLHTVPVGERPWGVAILDR
jgi:PQQ-dependent catabolism-associated beta-propeller protein